VAVIDASCLAFVCSEMLLAFRVINWEAPAVPAETAAAATAAAQMIAFESTLGLMFRTLPIQH
jgi:hypothetical protein